MATLPKLLEETARPHKKRLKEFYDYIHRWRYSIYRQWKSSVNDSFSDEQIGMAVDRLIGTVLLLEHCKRYEYTDVEVPEYQEIWKNGTLYDLLKKIAGSFTCPLLQRVFLPSTNDQIPLPFALLDSHFEQRIRGSVWMLLQDAPVPLWLFGDYHQLCVANPQREVWDRKRSSEERYARGIHYTPAPIVDYLTASVLDACFHTTPKFEPRILDPSCGCGSFLIASFRYLSQFQSQENREKRTLDILGQSLFGVDIDPGAIDWTIRLLYLECKRQLGSRSEEISPEIVPDISKNIIVHSFFDLDHTLPC